MHNKKYIKSREITILSGLSVVYGPHMTIYTAKHIHCMKSFILTNSIYLNLAYNREEHLTALIRIWPYLSNWNSAVRFGHWQEIFSAHRKWWIKKRMKYITIASTVASKCAFQRKADQSTYLKIKTLALEKSCVCMYAGIHVSMSICHEISSWTCLDFLTKNNMNQADWNNIYVSADKEEDCGQHIKEENLNDGHSRERWSEMDGERERGIKKETCEKKRSRETEREDYSMSDSSREVRRAGYLLHSFIHSPHPCFFNYHDDNAKSSHTVLWML